MGCSSSTASAAAEQNHAEPSPDNNNASTFPDRKVSEEEPHRASQEAKEVNAVKRTADERKDDSCVVSTKAETKCRQLTILHFNDVYNIEPREKEPVGGAARFATKLASFRHLNPLIVFSGDCLNPSTSEYISLLLQWL